MAALPDGTSHRAMKLFPFAGLCSARRRNPNRFHRKLTAIDAPPAARTFRPAE